MLSLFSSRFASFLLFSVSTYPEQIRFEGRLYFLGRFQSVCYINDFIDVSLDLQQIDFRAVQLLQGWRR